MLTTEAMELVNIAVLKERCEDVMSRLLKLGVFHPVDIRNMEEGLDSLSRLEIEKERSFYENAQARMDDLARKTGLELLRGRPLKNFSQKEIEEKISSAESLAGPMIKEREELRSQLKSKETILLQLTDYLPFNIDRPSAYTFLKIEMGRIEEKNMPVLRKSLTGVPHIIYPFRREGTRIVLLLIGLRRDRELLDKVMKDLAWQRIDYTSEPQTFSKDLKEQIKKEMESFRKDIEAIGAEIARIKQRLTPELSDVGIFLSVQRALLEAKRYSCATEKTAIISGWVPVEEIDSVMREIKKTDPSSYIEDMAAEKVKVPKEEIPVKLKHPSVFRPFEFLVSAYGIPRYGSIDPTIFVAISFLVMFGAMFGDLGHGVILCILSAFMWRSRSRKVKQAGTLLLYCGLSSEVFGFLYGSIFGYEFKSLWIKPMHDIVTMLRISIFFGIAMISIGTIINVLNALKDKDYVKAFFDKSGLIAGIIYWTGIALISKMIVSKGALNPVYVFIFIACLVALMVKPLAEVGMSKEKESMAASFMEGLINILEVVMGYLANTVSFIRIAAFALAHTGLFLSIFELSRIMKSIGGDLASGVIIVLGNIVIILLEGLVVSIQSLRLNYYEFFSKFFVSGKCYYKPLRMKT